MVAYNNDKIIYHTEPFPIIIRQNNLLATANNTTNISSTFICLSRHANHQRSMNRQIKVVVFTPFRMFSKMVAMVTEETNHSVVFQSQIVQCLDYSADQGVSVAHCSVVGLPKKANLVIWVGTVV